MKIVRKTARFSALIVGLAMFVATARAADMVDNPEYQSWAKHAVGTSVTQHMDMAMTGMNMKQEMTHTLMEIKPDSVTIETKMTMDMGGQKQERSNTRNVAAKVEKGHEYLPENMKGEYKETGKEKIEIGGKSYECTVGEMIGETPQGKMTGKMWRTLDIPGGLAKMEMQMEQPMAMKMSLMVTNIMMK